MTNPQLRIALCALALAPLSSFGQAAPTNDEVVTLSEFQVKGSPTSEYLAAESVTGTRVATRIQDLPFAVNVVTAEFINDFNLIEYKDQFSYVSNVGQAEGQSPGYTLRGFTADVQLRNGFRRIGLIDKVNVDRVEIIKGPAASIYGAVIPGGAVNVITKRPESKPKQSATVTIGELDLYRGEVSSTGPVGASKKVFYRFDGAYYERGFETPFRNIKQYTGALQLLFKLSDRTSLLVEGERLVRDERANTSATIPFISETRTNPWIPTRTYTHYLALADHAFTYTAPNGTQYQSADLTYFSTQGPRTFGNRWVNSGSFTFEHRINDVLSLRSGGSIFKRDLERVEVGSRDQYNPVTQTIQRGTARQRNFPEGGAALQNDLLASYTTGAIKHKTLFTLDYNRATEQPRQWDAATNAAFNAGTAAGLSVTSPDYYFIRYNENPSLYSIVAGSSSDSTTDSYGVFLSQRSTLLDDRLNLMVGGRWDRVEKSTTQFVGGAKDSSNTNEITYQVGANYAVFRGATLFASASTSFTPQPGAGQRLNAAGTGFESFLTPNETGKGWEAGFKLAMLSDRLTMTASYFDITRHDVVGSNVNVTLANGQIQSVTPINVEATKGGEVDFSFIATPEWQLFGGYGYNNGRIEESDTSRFLVGDRLRRAPRYNWGVATKYEFRQGRLKGLFATAGVKYTAASQANVSGAVSVNPSQVNATNPFTNRRLANGLLPIPQLAENAVVTSIPYTVLLSNNRGSVVNDPYYQVDAGVGYKWKRGRFSQRLQVNISNLGDVRYTFGSSAPGDPRMISVTYGVQF